MHILAAEKVAGEGLALLRSRHTVDEASGLSQEELLERIGAYDALLVRSATKVTPQVIERGTRLRVIARAGVGVDNVDVAAATRRGILVVNTPAASTVAAAEHALGLILALLRNIPRADRSMKDGRWDRKAFMGLELRSKTVGVVGLGRIGSEVARLLLAMNARVIAYDPVVRAEIGRRRGIEMVDFGELLSQADIITIHAPMTEATRYLINADTIAKMRDGVFLVNCARGGIVSAGDLADGLADGKIAGAALDVYETEPPAELSLVGMDNVIATPHIAASTVEAQRNIGVLLAQQVLDALEGRPVGTAVNLPSLPSELVGEVASYVELLSALARIASALAEPPLSKIEVGFSQEVPAEAQMYLARQAVAEALSRFFGEGEVSAVNAWELAGERGIEIRHGQIDAAESRNHIMLSVAGAGHPCSAKGTVGPSGVRVLEVNGFVIDLHPAGSMLLTVHRDQPGVVAEVTSELAHRQINISEMHLARSNAGGKAIMLVGVDCALEEGVVDAVSQLGGVERAFCLTF